MKAMIINRIGDVGLALAMFVCFDTFKTIEFAGMFSLVPSVLDSSFFCIWSVI